MHSQTFLLLNPDAAASGGGAAGAPPAATPDAAASKPWYDGYSDVKYVEGKGWKSPLEAIDSYRNAEKLIGADPKTVLRLPSPTDDASKWAEVYDRIGRPKTPQDYKFKDVEGVQFDQGRKEAVAKLMHETGLTASQASKLYEWYGNDVKTALESKSNAEKQQRTAAETALKNEWKAEYDSNLKTANAALLKFGGEEMVAELEKLGLQNHPSLIKTFASIGKQLLEDSAQGKAGSGFATDAQNAQLSLIHI